MVKEIINKSFRLQGKNLFLTYAQCPLDLNLALDQLKHITSSYIIKEYILVREFHAEDGKPHIHAYLSLHKPFNTYSPNRLDLKEGDNIYHGKYESAKQPNKVIEYILKCVSDKNDPNVIFSNNLSNRIDLLGTFMSLGDSIIKLAREGKITEALNLYEREKPLDFVKSHKTLEKSLRELYLRESGFTAKFNLNQYIIPEDFKLAMEALYNNKTLIIIGPPGTGKTQFISTFLSQSMGLKPLIVNNIDALRFINNKHGAIVFDDCSWKTDIDRESLIKLLDSEGPTSHNIKHGSVFIEKSTPRVVITNKTIPFVSNPYPAHDGDHYQDPAVKRRIVIFNLSFLTEMSRFGSYSLTALILKSTRRFKNLKHGKNNRN